VGRDMERGTVVSVVLGNIKGRSVDGGGLEADMRGINLGGRGPEKRKVRDRKVRNNIIFDGVIKSIRSLKRCVKSEIWHESLTGSSKAQVIEKSGHLDRGRTEKRSCAGTSSRR